jgi:hypothetical protein
MGILARQDVAHSKNTMRHQAPRSSSVAFPIFPYPLFRSSWHWSHLGASGINARYYLQALMLQQFVGYGLVDKPASLALGQLAKKLSQNAKTALSLLSVDLTGDG